MSILYALLKPPVRLLVWFYYRKVKVFGAENLPRKGAVIIISNHQNALLDPVISCVLLKRQIHWLTRADVFRKPLANKILRGLNMMPVYRAHDKADLRTANDPTFQECTRLLKNGSVIGLFPEGTHHGGKYLKPLKKGLARIALASMQELPDTKIYLVPVGVDYENSFHSGYDLCLSVGKPVDLEEFRSLSPNDSSALQKFTQLSDAVLSAEMIDLRNPEIADYFAVLEDVLADIQDEEKGKNFGAFSAFLSLRKSELSSSKNEDLEHWKQTAESWKSFQAKHNFVYQRGSLQPDVSAMSYLLELLYLLFIPFHWALYPARWITRALVRFFVDDIHFTSSIKILLAPIVSFFAIWFMLFIVFVASFSPERSLLTLLLALVYLIVWPCLQRNRSRSRCGRILKRLKNNPESAEEWLIIRAQISNLVVKNL